MISCSAGVALLIAIAFNAVLCDQTEATSTVKTGKAFLLTGGLRGHVLVHQVGPNVLVVFGGLVGNSKWQIHQIGVDFTIDPKLRCGVEHVGRLLYSGEDRDYIYNVTVDSLILNSMVVIFQGGPVILCGTIAPDSVSYSYTTMVSVQFKSGLFGKLYILQWPSGSYLTGELITEKSRGNLQVQNVSIVLHNTTLGPYDILLQGCDSLSGGPTLRVLVADVSFLSNSTLHQQLFRSYRITSYSGYAVSMQTTSGTILGCGRLETVFPVDATYQGIDTLSQFSPFFPARLLDTSQLDILKYNILDSMSGTCSSKAAIFDPWSPLGPQLSLFETSDQFPVGDLPNHKLEVFSLLPEVPLIGTATVLGHVVNDSECSSLELTVPNEGYIVKGYAVFSGPTLTGRVTFTQAVYLPDWVLGPTVVTVDLAYTDSNQSTNGHTWYIHEGFTEVNGTCSDHIGAQYNPYAVSTTAESGYFDDCTSLSQQRCAMGDLSGKLGAIGLEPVTASPHKTYSFYDENLHLLGPFTVLGRSIVVYDTGAQSGQLLGCANIEPSLAAEEEISFPRNGSNPDDIDRLEMGRFLSMVAGVPLGDVLVNDVEAVNISGHDCLTASLWITGVNAENVSENAGNVSALDRQYLSHYSAGPCVPPPTVGVPITLGLPTVNDIIIAAVCILVVVCLVAAILLAVALRKKKEVVHRMYKVEGQQEQAQYSKALVKLLPTKKDRWELLGSYFKVGTKLGEGNFGQVYKGTLSVDVATKAAKRHIRTMIREGKLPYTVAIKLLKGGADERAVENFLDEIVMMKKVSSGECCHVVQMVGCVSTALPLALALEFVPFGDLLSYLKHWRQKSAVSGKDGFSQPCVLPSPGYDKLFPKEGSEEGLYVDQLQDTTGVDTSNSSDSSYPKEGGEKGLQVAVTQDQGSCREEEEGEEGLPLTTIETQKSVDSEIVKGYSPTNEEQGLLSPSLGQHVDKQCRGDDGLSQPIVFLSPGYDRLNSKEGEEGGMNVAATGQQEGNADGEGGVHLAGAKEQKMDYSPLGEPDLRDLPSFAFQIAQGMEFLSSLGVLHRDLACRNILVDERKLLKISDFGLSRETTEYVSSLKDMMPLRLMAPETVAGNVCTDKSDVWSFGVCLWEMYTLGELPYRNIPMQSLAARVVSGYRLPQPEHASEEVYQLMLSCWRSEPQARLSFTQLQYSFKSIVATHNTDTNYITVQPNTTQLSKLDLQGTLSSICEEDCHMEVA